MDERDLYRFITTSGIAAEIILLTAETPTVAAAAAALGVEPTQIIKSVLFIADQEPVLVIGSGLLRLSDKRLADYLGVARRRVRVASGEKVLVITGYPPGTVPPFGHVAPLRTLLEAQALLQTVVFGGAGVSNGMLRLTIAELQRVVGAECVALVE